jgi:peptide/nickel transport system substrate-binding protein
MLPPMLYWNDQLKPYPYDIAQAKSLLAAAGYGSGLSAEILEPSGNAEFNQVATILKSEFAAIGVNLTITTLEISANRARRKVGDFDLYQAYSNSDIIDPSELVDWQIDYTGGGVAKWGSYKSERIIQLAKAASTEIDPKKRKAMYFEAQKIAYDDAEAIPLYNPNTRTAFWTNVHDFTTPPTFNWRLWEVWVSKK